MAHKEMGARVMVAMNIRGLAPKVRQALKERAARHGLSMEEEVRRILIHAVGADEPGIAPCPASRLSMTGIPWPWAPVAARPRCPPGRGSRSPTCFLPWVPA